MPRDLQPGDIVLTTESLAVIKEQIANELKETLKPDPLDCMPIGYIYISAKPTSPEELFGGKWDPIDDERYLRLANEYKTGGSNTWKGSHNHTEAAHSHKVNSHNHSVGAHNHGLNSHTHTINNHNHDLQKHTHSVGAHNHGLNSHTHTLNSHTHSLTSGWGMFGMWSTTGANSRQVYQYKTGITSWVPNYGYTNAGNPTSGNQGSGGETTAMALGGSSGGPSNNASGPSSGNTANSTAFNSGEPSTNVTSSVGLTTNGPNNTTTTANNTAFNSGDASPDTDSKTPTINNTELTVTIEPKYQDVYGWVRVA